jgi:hypothetical protein
MYQLANCQWNLTHDIWKCFDLFIASYNYRPSRSEALADLAQYLEQAKMWNTLYHVTKGEFALSQDMLFVNSSAHWRIIEKHAFAAYYLGDRQKAKMLLQRIIDSQTLDANQAQTLAKNLAIMNSV